MEHTLPNDAPVTRIAPHRGWFDLRIRDLWMYRDLLYFLTWRDVKVRYKQTALGAVWAVLQPFLMMVVFSVFFKRMLHVPSDGFPYPIFAYVALLPWTVFAQSVSQASKSLVAGSNLVKKVYFPRLFMPLGSVLAMLVDFFLGGLVYVGLMLYYHIIPHWTALLLPAFLLLAFCTALGVSLWLSALNVQYRDVQHTVPFLIQIWLFMTPVIYPTSLLGRYKFLMALNPMTGVVEGFRWGLLGAGRAPGAIIFVSVASSLIILVTGLLYFRHMESTFADTI
ncbi:MAG: ABC transporter permease [Acidobacteriota bacterium]